MLAAARPFAADVAVCVPFPYLARRAVTLAGSDMRWGAQDCSAHEQGAYTGEVSAAMLAEFGCRYAIVGHSERRAVPRARPISWSPTRPRPRWPRGVTPIVCVGETLAQREAGETEAVVKRQLSAVIHTLGALHQRDGGGLRAGVGHRHRPTATPEQAQAGARRAARAAAGGHARMPTQMKILYGGSVKADNARTLFAQPDIDGGLIGGASLKAADFVAICRAAG